MDWMTKVRLPVRAGIILFVVISALAPGPI